VDQNELWRNDIFINASFHRHGTEIDNPEDIALCFRRLLVVAIARALDYFIFGNIIYYYPVIYKTLSFYCEYILDTLTLARMYCANSN